jgi:outer membrane protein
MKLTLIILSIVVGILSVLMLQQYIGGTTQSNKKTAYIITGKLFSEFEGTKELKQQARKEQQKQSYILDSLRLNIEALEKNKVKGMTLDREKILYNKLLSEFSGNNEIQLQEFDEQIWKQLNQYIQDYGKTQDYKIIYGADGRGSIMYADSTMNITEQVLEYANQKYAGK